ncbi:MAG: hypothetical protein JST16_09140 [Bdellovibrionales bacterium]|nr:hypothetical protein [Bdellovibrionales bacterium]
MLLVLLGTHAYAQSSEVPLRSRLIYETNLKARGLFEVKREQNALYANGRQLSPYETLPKGADIAFVFAPHTPTPGGPCSAGFYQRTVERQGKMSTETGCLESPRFGELVTAFKKIVQRSFDDQSARTQ